MRKFFFAVAFVFHAFAFSVTVQASSSLVIAAGLDDVQYAALLKRAGGPQSQVIRLEKSVLARAGKLLEEIDKGLIHETGPRSPPSLKAFSAEILAAIPNIFEASEIHVVSEQMLPIELVNDRRGFLGDMAPISHEYDVASYTPQVVVNALNSYTIEAVIGMPPGMPRAKQDIVELALSLEQELPVDIRFNSGLRGLQSSLRRTDLSVLHIDTHGSDKGLSIQASRAGDMMQASDLPASIHPRLVLLFGCEGVAQADSFGSELRARGAKAVISSFAKFTSFGITGDAVREKRVYEAFFGALKDGEDVAGALLRFRVAARGEMIGPASERSLTRLFFVVVGNGALKFTWPAPVPN